MILDKPIARTIDSKNRFLLPKDLLEKLEIDQKTFLQVFVENGNIILQPVDLVKKQKKK